MFYVLILAEVLFTSNLFNDTAINSKYIASKDGMIRNDVLGETWKETVVAEFKIFWNFPVCAEDRHWNRTSPEAPSFGSSGGHTCVGFVPCWYLETLQCGYKG